MTVAENLLECIHGTPSIIRLRDWLAKERRVHLKGAVGSLKSLVLADVFARFSTQMLVISVDPSITEGIKADLERLLGEDQIAFFPGSVLSGGRTSLSSHVITGPRLHALESLSQGKEKIIVADGTAFLKRLPRMNQFSAQKLSLSVGDEVDFEKIIARLIRLGFVREARAEQAGEMAVRGGIVDIFPHSYEAPIRVEFWGDLVESLRRFDPDTQRSTETIARIDLYPQDLDVLESDCDDGARYSNLLDYLKEDALLFLDEPELIRKKVDPDPNREMREVFAEDDELVQSEKEALWSELEQQMRRFRQVRLISLGEKHPNLLDLNASGQDPFKGNMTLLKQNLQKLCTQKLNGYAKAPQIFFLSDSSYQVERFKEIFIDEDFNFPTLKVAALGLHQGFIFPEANLVIYTDHQFYGRAQRLRLPKRATPGLTPKQLKHLNQGDFVAHVDYGIGIFRGLEKITVGGHERECLHLEYREGDKVYVKVERMDRVYKYSSKDGAQPTLSKLGSPGWQRLKNKTKKRIKDIAEELIEIYAKRRLQQGYAFEGDNLWQRELEASFPYEDTPDQIKATLEVKKDMESEKPMDRLVCGDVGFGKTEIAVRAAFKAVLSGKQVAMLVPTTLLAYQHYHTFKERLENFPIRVEMLSRFRTSKEQKQIIEKLHNGQLDIVIGTHRLLSKDVTFKDLGLLMVDEEQHFGVRHKEQLKKYRASVDVLTLTATPIPRTLQFALMGARDITDIQTPPKNRLPIVTEVLPFNKHYIREAILRELDRDGQVFFVHNRVHSIDRVAKMLSHLIPEANVAVAHGQMHERELEKVMIDFTDKKFEILVSTMIIESGLDMPNVNTIIINRADKLGLAQLYQLRGRVGRSHQRAFAYLLIPSLDILTDDALKRLRAIEEFSEIGFGARLAMRDLEIRGAGNLLGAEQSGFIDALGFDLYNKVLDEAVKELKQGKSPSEPATQEVETQLEMDCDAYLPGNYVEDSSERVDIYRRLTEVASTEELEEIRLELQDRFGRLPQPVANLLDYLEIRMRGKRLGIKKITIAESEMLAEFSAHLLPSQGEHFKKWLGSMLENADRPFEFIQNEGLGIRLQTESSDNKLFAIKNFLESLTEPANQS